MAEFSIVDAALAGPRLIVRDPRTYLVWVGFQLLCGAVYVAFVVLLFGSALKAIYDAAMASQVPAQSVFLSLIPKMALAFLIIVPLAVVYYSMTRAAPVRAILHDDRRDRWGYLRLGADELRVFATIFVVGCIKFAVQLVVSIPVGMLSLLFAALIRNAVNPSPFGQIVAQQAAGILAWPVLIFFFLKFVLAVPQTLATGRISIFDSWVLTRGRLWRMFLSYVIVTAIALVVGLITAVLVVGVVGGVAGFGVFSVFGKLQSNPQEALRQLTALIIPLGISLTIISAIVSPFFTALYSCPAAYIYRTIHGRTEDVF